MNANIETVPTREAGDELKPGDTVGPYELLFETAQGGMATVWAARIRGVRGFQKIVAVKALSNALRWETDAQAMFLDEARLSARIVHPNVAQILDYGEAQERPYMAMEWIEGESLARIASAQRARGGLLPLRWVVHVAAAACAGLHAAHEARDEDGEPLHLVHRDVSPQNIMVTFDGFTKVVDFGVAKWRRRTQVTRVGVIKGKTGYFSPEQIRGGEIDRRSDLFSFGILLYLLTTDRHPFRGRSAVDTMQNIATRVPYAPRDLVPDLPPALDRLILRALAKDPDARFQTAAELQFALERVALELGGRLSDREVGAIARDLLPGVADGRRARLIRVAERLDRSAIPGSDHRGTGSHAAIDIMQAPDLIAAFECTATEDRRTIVESSVAVRQDPAQAGPFSEGWNCDVDRDSIDVVHVEDEEERQTDGTSSLSKAATGSQPPAQRPQVRASTLARLTLLTTLALLVSAVLVARAPERVLASIAPAGRPTAEAARRLPRWHMYLSLVADVVPAPQQEPVDPGKPATDRPARTSAPAASVRRSVPRPPLRHKRARPSKEPSASADPYQPSRI